MIYLKYFEDSIKDEFPGMFEPEKYEPEVVPGFENGTIDPEDDEPWDHNEKSEKQLYKEDFLPLVRERNFQEDEDEIIINIKKLWEDFMMSIYAAPKHFKIFLNKELTGKYISSGFIDLLTQEPFEGTIEGIGYLFDGNSCFISFKLKGHPKREDGYCEEYITIDKLKSTANNYNL